MLLSFVKLIATYGRQLFALIDSASVVLKGGRDDEGGDGTVHVRVREATTDVQAVRALEVIRVIGIQPPTSPLLP